MYSQRSRYVWCILNVAMFQYHKSDQFDCIDHNSHIYPTFHSHDKSGWHSLYMIKPKTQWKLEEKATKDKTEPKNVFSQLMQKMSGKKAGQLHRQHWNAADIGHILNISPYCFYFLCVCVVFRPINPPFTTNFDEKQGNGCKQHNKRTDTHLYR